MHFVDSSGEQLPGTLYGKVLGLLRGTSTGVSIRFTSVSPEIDALLRKLTADQAPSPQH
jgi:hypothetical protein